MRALEEDLDRTFQDVGQRERPRLVNMGSREKIEKQSTW